MPNTQRASFSEISTNVRFICIRLPTACRLDSNTSRPLFSHRCGHPDLRRVGCLLLWIHSSVNGQISEDFGVGLAGWKCTVSTDEAREIVAGLGSHCQILQQQGMRAEWAVQFWNRYNFWLTVLICF